MPHLSIRSPREQLSRGEGSTDRSGNVQKMQSAQVLPLLSCTMGESAERLAQKGMGHSEYNGGIASY